MSETPSVVYLVKVEPGANNNKFYKMIPKGDHWDAEYGRVGAGSQTRTYPMYEWKKKYNEKIKKGYVDRTDLVADLIEKEKPVTHDGYRVIENKVIA